MKINLSVIFLGLFLNFNAMEIQQFQQYIISEKLKKFISYFIIKQEKDKNNEANKGKKLTEFNKKLLNNLLRESIAVNQNILEEINHCLNLRSCLSNK